MRAVSLALSLAAFLAVVSPTRGSVVRPFTLQELYSTAELVVVGEVVGQTSFWNEAHDTIYTEYTIQVERVVKGRKPLELRLRLMGGSVDGQTLRVPGNAQVEVGERVLVALRDQGAFQTLVGMSQGKWSIRRLGGQDVAWRGARLPVAEPLRDGEVPLDDLLDDLQRDAGRTP